jgi:hypothetical protein
MPNVMHVAQPSQKGQPGFGMSADAARMSAQCQLVSDERTF